VVGEEAAGAEPKPAAGKSGAEKPAPAKSAEKPKGKG
jgi:hypothetical protein